MSGEKTVDALARIGFNLTNKYFDLDERRRNTLFVLGDSVHDGRPVDDRDPGVTAYWNASRCALRLRSPDPTKPWRTIAQGFASEEELRSIGSHAADRTPVRSVALVPQPHGPTLVYINLPDEVGVLHWRQLRVREEHNIDAVWDLQTYVRTKQTEPTVTTDAEGATNMSETAAKVAADSKFEAVKKVISAETEQALWRSAATQVTRTARDLFLASAKKAMPKQRLIINQIGKVLCTPMGEAAFGYALGIALELKAGAGDLRRKRLASELRIGGEAAALNVIINPVREFLTTGIDTILNGIDGLALPDATPAALPDAQPAASFDRGIQQNVVPASRG